MKEHKSKIIIGFCIFTLIIYNRVFRIREEKAFLNNFDLFLFLGYSMSTIVMSFLCVYNIVIFYKWITKKKSTESSNGVILFIKYQLIKIRSIFYSFSNSLEAFDSYIKNSMPYYNDEARYTDIIVEHFGIRLEKYAKISITLLLTIIFFCQAIVLLSFSYDLLYCNEFKYFYRYLMLLVFPLVINYIIYSINIYAKANLEALNEILQIRIIDKKELTKSIILAQIPRITLEEHYMLKEIPVELREYEFIKTMCPKYLEENPGIDITSTINKYEPVINILCKLLFYTESFYEKKKNYLSFFHIIRYAVYALGWLYLTYLLFE